MKKLYAFLFLFVLCFTGCVVKPLSIQKPSDTNLEFWITQEVTLEDFEGYREKYGWFGANEFYGTGYEPTMSEDNEQIDPESCVTYLVTKYPDYSSPNAAVTRIYITDPNVTFYGLSLRSTAEEIKETMEGLGYEYGYQRADVWATKGNVTFLFHGEEYIRITAAVTNRENIIF